MTNVEILKKELEAVGVKTRINPDNLFPDTVVTLRMEFPSGTAVELWPGDDVAEPEDAVSVIEVQVFERREIKESAK